MRLDGDILIQANTKDYFVVFKEYAQPSCYHNEFFSYASLDLQDNTIGTEGTFDYRFFRLADPQEVEQFHELLHKLSKEWDDEKKQLVDWKWKPKQGDDYYYINSIGRVLRSELYSCGIDKCETFFGFGNYFQTEVEAEAMAEKIKKLLNGELL